MSPVDKVQRLADYVAHIIDAARLARAYCLPMTQEQFAQDKKTQQAVLLNLMVIGEAVEVRSRVPRSTPRNPMESHQGNAQSSRARLFRRRPRYRLADGAERYARA